MKSSPSSVSFGNCLTVKNRVFYFRTAVPQRHRSQLGLTEFKLSLKTPYIEEAKARARLLSGRVQLLFNDLDGGTYHSMDKDLIRRLAKQYLYETLEEDEERRARSTERLDVDYCQHVADTHSFFRADAREALATRNYGLVEHATGDVIERAQDEGIDMSDFSVGSASYRLLCRELLRAQIKLCEVLEQREMGFYEDDYAAAPAPPVVVQVPAVAEAKAVERGPATLPRLSEAIDAYLKYKSIALRGKASWKEATAEDKIGMVKPLLFVLGDISIGDLDREKLEQLKQYIFTAPRNANKVKRYRGKTYKQLMAMTIPDEDKLSDQTVEHYFHEINSFLKWLCAQYQLTLRYEGILTIKLDIRADKQRAVFTPDELRKLFFSEPYVNGEFMRASYFWAPLIGLFTGARLEEICQLYLADFAHTDSGVWYINITGDNEDKQLKNKTAIRAVPIHDELIRLGLIERVEHLRAKGAKRLFPELYKTGKRTKYSSYVSRWFNALRLSLDIKETKGEGRKDFHSFRHTFDNFFKQQGDEGSPTWATMEEIVGHSRGGSESSLRYSKSINPDKAYELVISKLDYGLDLSHLRDSKYIRMIEKQPPKTGPKPKK